MKKIFAILLITGLVHSSSKAQTKGLEDFKRDPGARKAAPNRPMLRDSSVMFIVQNKAYFGWDPAFIQWKKNGLMDTSKYQCTVYENPTSETPVKQVLIFRLKHPG